MSDHLREPPFLRDSERELAYWYQQAKRAEAEVRETRALLAVAEPFIFHTSRCPRFAPDVLPDDPCTCGGNRARVAVARFLAGERGDPQ